MFRSGTITNTYWLQLLDLPIRITKLKDLQTHLRVQIPISTFHVEHSGPTFFPQWIASDRTCK